MMLPNQYGSQPYGSCLFVSRLPEDLANPDAIANLLGVYGDVNKVQMIKDNSAQPQKIPATPPSKTEENRDISGAQPKKYGDIQY